jgi:acetyltransferase-like isoleucine patch superfamily enzyme
VIAAERIAYMLVLPGLLLQFIAPGAFGAISELLSLAPGLIGVALRRAWYRHTLDACGTGLWVGFGSVIHKRQARIGNDCMIGENNRIGLADIGDDFMSSSHVVIISGRNQHGFQRRDLPMRLQPGRSDRVLIGEDVWIGASATVTSDVAPHSIVASGAVVTAAYEPYSILGGTPARPIGIRP